MPKLALQLVLFVGCVGCEASPVADGPGACAMASEAVGALVCIEEVLDHADWDSVAALSSSVDQVDAVKYLVPVSNDQPVPTAFVNSQRYALHYDFLREAFPETYGLLQWDDYVSMIIDPEQRAYYGGNISRYVGEAGNIYFGFIVWDNPEDPATTPSYDDVLTTWTELQERFGLADLVYVPWSNNQREASAGWQDAPFAIQGDDGVTYEAYNPAVGYGTMRVVALENLESASMNGEFGYQDIVVLDEAPMDLTRVVSGLVTGTRQAALSHLNVRMLAHGTPNCFVAEPETRLASWVGKLVRFECGLEGYAVATATQSEAEAHWAAMRPDPVEIRAPDLSFDQIEPLLSVATESAEARDEALLRFGAKAANLAILYQRIDRAYQLEGFGIPFSYYQRFVTENRWIPPDETVEISFADTLDAWHADPTFRSDTTTRNARLSALREAMLLAPLNTADAAAIESAVRASFGGDSTMLRLRSSSNAEDGVAFSGAGLYSSASACQADGLDDDDEGPSRCDNDKDDERRVDDALREVWASLWLAGAWEEREWYGIDQSRVVMGVLVNTQSEEERANIVGFTGNPLGTPEGWLVESQVGDLDVVSAESGVSPERVLLSVAEGEVSSVLRIAESSEVIDGQKVLTDAQLREVGALLWIVDEVMPRDSADSATYRWDTEQKVLSDGTLVIKQVRPW